MQNDVQITASPLLGQQLQAYAQQLGFDGVAIATFDRLPQAKQQLDAWLAQGLHGSMAFLERHASIKADPTQLLPNAQCAILVRMNYLANPNLQITKARQLLYEPLPASNALESTAAPIAQISWYAQGRDYHTVLRQRLKQLVGWLHTHTPKAQHRVFTDSAPVMEVELAQAAGLGWRGKHTLLLNSKAGSFFFLGGILTTLPAETFEGLSPSPAKNALYQSPRQPQQSLPKQPKEHCGSCTACLDICPTQAIIAPYQVDARRCISYLTIEHVGAIPIELRPLLGFRIYGCDDCQIICPWNKFAKPSMVVDFLPRHGLDASHLLTLWAWSESEFLERLEGSAIRRIGHARWLRNLATALGNALAQQVGDAIVIQQALSQHLKHFDAGVREHVAWALEQG